MTCSILFSRHEKPISITYNLFIIYNFVIPFSASKSIASLGNKNILQKLLIQKDIFLKIYSHYNHTVNNKNSNVTKTAPQRPICSWQFVKCPSWWSLFKTSTPLFSSIKKLGSDKISSIVIYFTMILDILFLEYQLHHCYLMRLILDHQVLQQSKPSQTQSLVFSTSRFR